MKLPNRDKIELETQKHHYLHVMKTVMLGDEFLFFLSLFRMNVLQQPTKTHSSSHQDLHITVSCVLTALL